MPAASQLDEDASSSSDDGFEVKAVTTAEGVRHAKFTPPTPRPASSLRALTAYDAASSSSTDSSHDDERVIPVSKPRIKKRVRFAQPESPKKRARKESSEDWRRVDGESADEEAVLMSELAQFEASVEDINRDHDAVTDDLLDANDFHEQLAQQRFERRVALLRRRLHDKNVVHGVRDGVLVNMDVDELRKQDSSDDDIDIRGVLRPP